MIEGLKILGLIPARGGSKTIPRKNLKLLAGKPLIAWTIEESHKSQYIDRLILSSEDAEIISVAQKWGCEVPFIRPAELAEDDTPSIETVIHAINKIGESYDYIVLLQPTSPLRSVNDIDDCIGYCVQKDADVCISVSVVEKNPYWMYTLNQAGKLISLLQSETYISRRQDLPPIYAPNGAIYIAKTEYIKKEKHFLTEHSLAYIMTPENSWDIDNELDFLICSLLIWSSGCGQTTMGG